MSLAVACLCCATVHAQELPVGPWERVDGAPRIAGEINWRAVDGTVHASGSRVDAVADERSFFVTGSMGEGDYTLRTHFVREPRNVGGRLVSGAYGVVLRFRNPDNYYGVVLEPRGEVALFRVRAGEHEELARKRAYAPLHVHNFLDVSARKDRLTVRLNGRQILQAADRSLVAGRAGFFSDAGQPLRFRDVRIFRAGSLPFEYVPLLVTRPPYVLWAAEDRAVIMWETNRPALATVTYREEGATRDEVLQVPPAQGMQRVVLTGLRPGPRYVYRVRIEGRNRGGGEFQTGVRPGEAFRIGFIGNTSGFPERFEAFNTLLSERAPNFVVNLGNIVERAEYVDEWDVHFFRPGRHLLGRVPTYVAMGQNDQTPHRRWFNHFLPYPGAGLERNAKGDSVYYAFTYGNAAFLVLDTYMDLTPGSTQYAWADTKLASPTFQQATWRVVIAHEPPYGVTRGRWGPGNDTVREHVVPLCARHNVHLLVTGHENTYKRGRIDDVILLVNGGGGGHDRVPFGAAYQFAARLLGYAKLHYSLLDVDEERLTWTTYNLQNQVLDRFTLEAAAAPAGDTPAPGALTRRHP